VSSIVRLPRAVAVQIYVEFPADDRTDQELLAYAVRAITIHLECAGRAPQIGAGIVPVRQKGP